MNLLTRAATAVVAVVTFAGCHSSDAVAPGTSSFAIRNEVVTVNPSGYAPLTANIHAETDASTTVSLKVTGKHGALCDVVKTFTDAGTVHNVPILGLYADADNKVELVFKSASGDEVGRKTYTLRTAALPATTFPLITIDTRRDSLMADGMTLVSYFRYGTVTSPVHRFIFDRFGDIRWFLDYATHPTLKSLFYDNGIERLKNGHWYFGDNATSAIYEVDVLGNVVNTFPLPGYKFHHQVLEKPNGNFLVSVSIDGASTSEDVIVEIDRSTRQIITTWDLRTSLQVGRRTLSSNVEDWLHVNGLAYDASDNTIIVSGRTQGLFKLTAANRVVWIMGAYRGWGTAGDGTDLRTVLLTPLDRNGAPITDPLVLDGTANHPDFEWNWYQHAPKLLPNGHIMLVDNGDNRNFGASPSYSRAVEYVVDNQARTVKQVWTCGKEGGTATYSRIASDVDLLDGGTHVVWSPGAIGGASPSGKVIELDYATQQVLFEATMIPPTALFGITMHRTERLNLYP